MPWITKEMKAAKQQEEDFREADRQEERAAEEFLASPVEMAAAAKQQGQGFFEVQLLVGSSQRDTTIFGGNNSALTNTETKTHAGTLAAIESVGWRLEHVGHVFVVTNESSRNKFWVSGQQTAVSGETIGIYLFRNPD